MKLHDLLFMLTVIILAGSIISRMDFNDPLDIQGGILAFVVMTLLIFGVFSWAKKRAKKKEEERGQGK